MANTARRKIRGDKMFLPMNIQGGSNAGKEYFITIPKLLILLTMAFITWYIIALGRDIGFKPLAWVVIAIVLILIYQKIIRKFVLEEKYFYSIYDRANKLENVTPDLFWRVSSIRKSPDGDILVYSDMKIGCILKLERDTIVGKAEDSSEIHYDAWSDFYRELHTKDLRFMQMNIMEPSGKDPRLTTLSNTASKAKNTNVREALELEMGYLKAISSATLSEFDYILIYTTSIARIDSLIDDIAECSYKLLNGAYSSVKILHEKEIYELPKTIHNVEFFDGVQAQMNVYRESDRKIPTIMRFIKLRYSDGSLRELNEKDGKKLAQLSSLVSNGALRYDEWSVKEALNGEIEKLNNFNSSKKVVQQVDEHNKKKDNKKSGNKDINKSIDRKNDKKVEKLRKNKEPKNKLFSSKGIDLSMEDEDNSEINDETEINNEDEDLLS